jgi:hypothetical protein
MRLVNREMKRKPVGDTVRSMNAAHPISSIALVASLALAFATGGDVHAQGEARKGNYCVGELRDAKKQTFRAALNSRAEKGYDVIVIRKRQKTEDFFFQDPQSFDVSYQYATFTVFDKNDVKNPKNSLIIAGEPYKQGDALTPEEVSFVESALKLCPAK